MTENHPITPPPNLVQEWYHEADNQLAPYYVYIATQAARWGADQELMACINWLYENGWGQAVDGLRDARRPKPPSLKAQALCHLESFAGSIKTLGMDSDLIRRALESLPN